jgi:predicted RNase H-like HicB family nuclease
MRQIMQFYTAIVMTDLESRASTVAVPKLPGCVSEGPDHPSAMVYAREATALWIASCRHTGDPVPAGPLPVQVLEAEIAEARAIQHESAVDLWGETYDRARLPDLLIVTIPVDEADVDSAIVTVGEQPEPEVVA